MLDQQAVGAGEQVAALYGSCRRRPELCTLRPGSRLRRSAAGCFFIGHLRGGSVMNPILAMPAVCAAASSSASF
jgi:hypothetical protein